MADPRLERLAEAHRRTRDAGAKLDALGSGLRRLAAQVDATIGATATGADRSMVSMLDGAGKAGRRAAQSADEAARLVLEAIARAEQEERERSRPGGRR